MKNRPFSLDPLFRAVTVLNGVGPKQGTLMEKLIGGPKILDLLFHRPIDVVDRRFSPDIKDAPNGKIATFEVTVEKINPSPRRGAPARVQCHDDTGSISLVFFKGSKDWLKNLFPIGQRVVISGKVEYYQGRPQMAHPDVVTPDNRESLERLEPVYPLTQGLTNKAISKAVISAQADIPNLPEWLDESYKVQQNWGDWDTSLKAVHNPQDESELSNMHPARQRLAYDELLANQLTLSVVRNRQRGVGGRSYNGDGALRCSVLEALPFELTGAQSRSLEEIYDDMKSPNKMLRLLQGDVGSGKTVVALMALLAAVECGTQGALMAPTEILARQHGETLKPLLDKIGVRFVILTGRDKGKIRETLLQQIRNGAAQIVIGTHALFQDSVEFADLGLAVIDEQHRFGVHQRLQLSSKNKGVDMLVMTATPIPRTLAIAGYGDMDISKLDEKPPGRKPVDTRLISGGNLSGMIEGLQRQIKDGARAYWVCPLVEESDLIDLAAAEDRYDVLKHYMGEDRVGLVHGRMKPAEKDAVMEKFVAGDLDVLVATTVIEVGVNVPEATIMVIEHAERFGLSQLHQLRGRVGRGGDQSYCFLLYHGKLGETAKERLTTMRDTADGCIIAEKDLKLRGFGDILGVKQSGFTDFRLADLAVHGELLAAARDDARLIMERDAELKTERGQALRVLLYLFERDQAIQYFRSG
jgi:ATP-dependent DNA helicase RecG